MLKTGLVEPLRYYGNGTLMEHIPQYFHCHYRYCHFRILVMRRNTDLSDSEMCSHFTRNFQLDIVQI